MRTNPQRAPGSHQANQHEERLRNSLLLHPLYDTDHVLAGYNCSQ